MPGNPPAVASFLHVLAVALLVALTGCTDIEGNEPGECEDGADNDSDGYFDCGDSDCFGAPVCQGGGSDDDDAADDDDDDDDDDDGANDDDTVGDDDDATGDGVSPWIASATPSWNAGTQTITFSIEAHDQDANFGIPLLLWSVDGAAQTPVNVGNIPLQADAWFDVQLQGATPGQTYQVLFLIQDQDGHQSPGFPVSATAS